MPDTTQADSSVLPLRLWPAIVVLVAQWIVAFGFGIIAPGTLLQFFGMLGGPILGLTLLLLWWFFLSRASWAERLAGTGLLIACLAATFALADPSATQAFTVMGIPLLCLASVVWLVAARRWDLRTRRLGSVAVVLVACLGWTLVRTNGVTGMLQNDYAWRWAATAEQRLLASRSDRAETPARSLIPPDAEEASWPGFRGARRDNRIEGLVIETAWGTAPPELIWKQAIGPSWSSFSVVGDRLFTQEQRGEEEIVASYDAASGKVLWLHRDPARFWEALAGAGPRATPTFDRGRIYALGATGILNCLDAASGERIWSRSLPEDTGAATPDWGFSSSPLIVGELAIVHAGGPQGKALVAYDVATGNPTWFASAGLISYSSPHLALIDGMPQVLILTDQGATSVDPTDGTVLWNHEWPLGGGARIVQPLVTDDGHVMIGTGFGKGLRSIHVSRNGGSWNVAEDWTSTGLKPYFNDFVGHRDHLFGFDGNILACIDTEQGARKWKNGRYGHGQVLLLADQDLLLVLAENGEVVLVDADPQQFREVARFQAISGKTWNHPVVVGDRLFVRNGEEAAAYRLSVSRRSARRR